MHSKIPKVFTHEVKLTTTGLRNATKRQKRLRSSISAALTACFSVSSSRWRCSVTSCSEVSTRRCNSPLFPLRAFFCNRSVSVDRFFSSAFARLYSAMITKNVTQNKGIFLTSAKTATKLLQNCHMKTEIHVIKNWTSYFILVLKALFW